LENPKRKAHKFHKNKSPFECFNYVPMGHKILRKKEKNSFKRTFENNATIIGSDIRDVGYHPS
jgi:hypothetical protein